MSSLRGNYEMLTCCETSPYRNAGQQKDITREKGYRWVPRSKRVLAWDLSETAHSLYKVRILRDDDFKKGASRSDEMTVSKKDAGSVVVFLRITITVSKEVASKNRICLLN